MEQTGGSYRLAVTEVKRGVHVRNSIGRRSEVVKKKTFEERMAHWMEDADRWVIARGGRDKEYMLAVPEDLRGAVVEIVDRNWEALQHEYPNRDRRFITNQVGRAMATRHRVVELWASDDGYKKVKQAEMERGRYKEDGEYLALTFKGSLLIVDGRSFGHVGGRVAYIRLPFRGTVDNVKNFDQILAMEAVSPDTLAVGKSFRTFFVSTSEVRYLYFKSGARVDQAAVSMGKGLFAKINARLAAVLNTA